MFNFITNLLNINENEVEDLKVVSLPSETQFHITLFPLSRPALIVAERFRVMDTRNLKGSTILFLQTEKPLSTSETTGISAMTAAEPFQVKIPLLFPLSKTPSFFSTES